MELPHFSEVRPLDLERVEAVAADAVTEVQRQDALARQGRFGNKHVLPSGPDHARLGVLVEEVGEVGRALNEGIETIVGVDRLWLRSELIQVAGTAIAWATALDEGR